MPHEIPSREWVAVCLLASIWIADMPPWHSIQYVSSCVPQGSIWIADIPLWNSIQMVSCFVPPGLHWIADLQPWNLIQLVSCCGPPGLSKLLTCHYKIQSREWVAVCLLSSIWIADMLLWKLIQTVSCCVSSKHHLNCWYTIMKYHSESELLCASWPPFGLLTYHYEISSS